VAATNPIIVIPARMAASRLPSKPLADIGGVPMIVRVMRQAIAAGAGPVIVAAGDVEIAEAVEAAGGRAVLTDPDLPSGTDRVHAALQAIDPDGDHDVAINLQGDMPFIDPAHIASLVHRFEEQPDLEMATLIAAEASPADRSNPDVVKAVVSLAPGADFGRALYFTRSTLYGDAAVWKHVGIYGYRREALERITQAPPTALEQREKLEQLRAMELGIAIWAAVVDSTPISVDSPADLERARQKAATL
jgi:3-deoxy-manno-octulosonate cytidylyltransferase (CMP-KDO synthetase)